MESRLLLKYICLSCRDNGMKLQLRQWLRRQVETAIETTKLRIMRMGGYSWALPPTHGMTMHHRNSDSIPIFCMICKSYRLSWSWWWKSFACQLWLWSPSIMWRVMQCRMCPFEIRKCWKILDMGESSNKYTVYSVAILWIACRNGGSAIGRIHRNWLSYATYSDRKVIDWRTQWERTVSRSLISFFDTERLPMDLL